MTLAPLYDTVPTVLWANLRADAAMSINARFALAALTIDDVVAEAEAWCLDNRRARTAAAETTEILADAASGDIPEQLKLHVKARCRSFLRD